MKKRLLALLLAAGMLISMLSVGMAEEYTFADDDGTGTWKWASDYIYDCYEEGIINGYSDGTYLPDNELTRAEAAKIIAVTYGLSSSASTSTFSDVADTHWALQYIEACVEAGIITGYSDGTFLPSQNVTRAEMAKMIAVASGLVSTAAKSSFSDVGTHWALQYIEACAEAGIITGYTDGTFLPGNYITRAEAAAIISRTLDLLNEDAGLNSDDTGSSDADSEELIAYYQDVDPATVAESEDGSSYVASQLLAVAEESASFDEVEDLFSAYDGEIVGYISFTDDYQIQLEGDYTYEELQALCSELEKNEILKSVTLLYVFELTSDSVDYTLDPWINANDTSDSSGSDWDEDDPDGLNWWAEAISMLSVWDMDLEPETVKVGIFDSMFDVENEDLDDGLFVKLWNNNVDVSAIYQAAIDGTGTITTSAATHGTHVAGLIAAQAENNFGIAGVSQNAELYGYAYATADTDSSDETNWGDVFMLKYAIALMLNEGVKVINISASYEEDTVTAAANGDDVALEKIEMSNASMTDFLLKYIDAGYEFLICKSAGNDGVDASYDIFSGITEESVVERIIVVGAAQCISGFFYEAEFTNTGTRVDVYAPGVDILSDYPTNITVTASGTSMATSIVSGIAALIWGVNPDLSASQVKKIINASQVVSVFQEEEQSALTKFWNYVNDYDLTAIVDAYFCVSLALNTDGTAEDLDTSYGSVIGVIYTLDENGDIDETVEFSNLEILLYDEEGNLISTLDGNYEDTVYTYSVILDAGTYTISVSANEYGTQTQTFTIENYDIQVVNFDMTEYAEYSNDDTDNSYSYSEEDVVNSGTCGDDVTWVLYSDGALIISGIGAMTAYSGRYDAPWSSYFDTIITVEIEDGVTSIGNYDFYYCTSLTSVTIGNSVTSIGSYAFGNCTHLTSVTIGNNVTSIDGYAFYNCTSLTSVTIPDNVVTIGGSAFRECTSLISITIPDSVTSIGSSAFANCTSLTSVVIGNNVTIIRYSAFNGCTSLTSVTIGSSVTVIQYWTFKDCTSLTSITIPDSVTNINNGAFANCTSLTSVMIPDSVTSITHYTFSGCTSLTSITIPLSVTSIEYGAFDDCTSLADVYYAGSEGDWNAISIGNENTYLTSATIHYNYTE